MIKQILYIFFATFLTGAGSGSLHAARAQSSTDSTDTMVMLYGGYSSYVRKTEYGMEGIIGDYVTEMAAKANLNIVWANTYDQDSILRRQKANVCYTSLIKTPERLTYVKFSDPIGQIPKYVVIASPTNKRISQSTTLKQIMQDKNLKSEALIGVSYGNYIDALVTGHQLQRKQRAPKRIVDLVARNILDYTIHDELTAYQLILVSPQSDKLKVYDHYTDLQNSVKYHIACTLTTDDSVITRMNKAINTMKILEQ